MLGELNDGLSNYDPNQRSLTNFSLLVRLTLVNALSVLMLCAPVFTLVAIFVRYENGRLVFSCFVRFLIKKLAQTQKCVLNMASSNS